MDYATAHTLLIVVGGALLTFALVGAFLQGLRVVLTFLGRVRR